MSRSLSEREREKLAGEIAALQSLDVEQLKARWRTLYQTEVDLPRFSRRCWAVVISVLPLVVDW
jgi:hypothetical protein